MRYDSIDSVVSLTFLKRPFFQRQRLSNWGYTKGEVRVLRQE